MAQLLSGLQLASIKPQRTEDDFRQDDFTNFCENIYFFQDHYDPIAHAILGRLGVAVGASGVGILPPQHSWW